MAQDITLLGTFKVRLARALSSLMQLKCPCPWQGCGTRWPLRVSYNSNYSVISMILLLGLEASLASFS